MRKGWLTVALAVALVVVVGSALYADKYKSSEWRKLKKDVEAALRGAEAETVIGLIRKIGEDDSKRAVEFLVSIGIQVSSSDAYEEIKTALASMSDKKALKEIGKQVEKSKDVRVRIMLIEVLGQKGGEEYVDDIGQVLADKKKQDMTLVRTAIEALGRIGGKKSMKYLIDYLEKVEEERKGTRLMGTDWYECRAALKHMTKGEADYETAADWRKYLESLPEDWQPVAPSDEEVSEDWKKGKVTTSVSLPKKTPKFFGTEVVSRTPVFVIDVSGSMTEKDPPDPNAPKEEEEEEKGTGTTPVDPVKKKPQKPGKQGVLGDDRMRIVRAQRELIKLIKMLDAGVMFNIVAYEREVHVWSRTGLKGATTAAKESAIKFVQGFQAVATTHMDDAVERAWENIKDGCDTIYLLSDGWPTHKGDNSDSPMLEEEILTFLRDNNKFRKVRVFTLGFKGAHREFMIKVARENGGTYKDIK